MAFLLLSVSVLLTLLAGLLIIRRISLSLTPVETYNGVPKPPLIPSWVPFLGNALQMASGDGFWTRAEKKYGPAFRILAMGQTRIFVTTPALINFVYKNTEAFNFPYWRKVIQVSGFGMQLATSFSPVFDDRLFAEHHRVMQSSAIVGVTQRYLNLLQGGIRGRLDQIPPGESEEVNLTDLVLDIMYTASSKAWFSPSFPSASTKNAFFAFDKVFPLLNLAALPSLLRSPAASVRDKLLSQIEEWWKTISDEDKKLLSPSSALLLDAQESEGWGTRDQASWLMALLWALEANAPYAGLWTIAEILRRPSLASTLKDEVTEAVSKLSPPALSTLLHLPQPELIANLPHVNAALQETLRYHTSSYSIRLVGADINLPASLCGNQTGFSLRKGDEMVCVTRMCHVDKEAEWGPDADVWDAERFLDGTRQKGPMMPYGGGVSMCEGRHFAGTEIIAFIAAFLHLADVEIVPGTDTLKPDMQRIGLAVLHTKGNLKVQLKRRAGR